MFCIYHNSGEIDYGEAIYTTAKFNNLNKLNTIHHTAINPSQILSAASYWSLFQLNIDL